MKPKLASAIVVSICHGNTDVNTIMRSLGNLQKWGNISPNQIRNLIKSILGLEENIRIDLDKVHGELADNRHYQFAAHVELEIS